MATVYAARDKHLHRTVALKVLHPQFTGDPEAVKRFRREAERAAGLTGHPNIVSIYDVGEDDGLRYIVMEFIEGRTLMDVIHDEAPFSVDRAFDISAEIASALEFAHRRGLIHRDIKPQNILMSPEGQVKVADFGIARALDATEMTGPGMVLGTAHYLSPEQAQGKLADFSSDLYALGIVLFEMLTARLPFEADNAVGIAMQHVQAEPPSPRRFNPAVSAEAAAVVLRGLNKQPSERYSSAAEFALALRRHVQQPVEQATMYRPISLEAGTETSYLPLAQPRRTMVLPVALAALAALVALGGWAVYGGTHSIRNKPVAAATVRPKPTSTRVAAATVRPKPTTARVATHQQPTASPTLMPILQPTATQPAVVTAPVLSPPGKGHGKDNGAGKGKDHGNGQGEGDG
jgi:serine/threonine protein kinase